MRRLFYSDTAGGLGSAALLALRLAMGAAFVLHGWPKIQTPLAWMGPEAPVPAVFQLAAALAEFAGGMALVVGLLARVASLGIATNMVVALAMVHLPKGDPFLGKPGEASYELAAVYLACALVFLVFGAGRFSLDRRVFGRPSGSGPT